MSTALDVALSRSGVGSSLHTAIRFSTEELFRLGSGGNTNATVLVVGRVQSGKTLSFTCLIARAADAGARLVVVLAGTKDILAKQTFRRLQRACDERRFVVTYNPRALPETVFARPTTSSLFKGRTHVAVLLKNATRISAIGKNISQQSPDWLGRVFVIDDEADSAGLNTRLRQGDRSPTYRAIGRLRRALPNHTYFQYTATPQANVFIPLVDHLSPDHVHLLEPGDGYVGGEALLETPCATSLIPGSDAEEASRGACPSGLSRALMQYLVGFVSWAKRGCPDFDVRCMLVHPSQLIDSHRQYCQFIEAKLGLWALLATSRESDDRTELLSEVADACSNLRQTFPDLDVTPDEVVEHLGAVRSELIVRAVNSDTDIDIDWTSSRGWILVGGANLDRGFTIPGLAVTYMPRGAGQGYVDTLQQRGRFFGYVRSLLPEIRVHLDPIVRDRYREIVSHEHDLHEWLRGATADGRSVRELRRSLVMSKHLQPTRPAVVDPAVVITTAPEWWEQSSVPRHVSIARRNLAIIQEWIEAVGQVPTPLNGSAVSPFQRHIGHCQVPLVKLVELLAGLQIGDPDESRGWYVALTAAIRASRGVSSATGSIIFMRPEARPQREVNDGTLRDLLQGRSDGGDYPGDRSFVFGQVTLQVHVADLREDCGGGLIRVQEKVPVLALRVAPALLQKVVMLDA
jgi:hypothetical protein